MKSNIPELVSNETGIEAQPGLTLEPVSRWSGSLASTGKSGGQRGKGDGS